MNKKELEAFAREAAKGIKTEKDLNDFSLLRYGRNEYLFLIFFNQELPHEDPKFSAACCASIFVSGYFNI
tara:strand:+ start:473 stop:682 length:210 start_codon:yes stop_codon:yes gene_type:complete